jgi:hypothetical protein
MSRFAIFQQFPPLRLGETDAEGNDLHAANLLRVGEVNAPSGAAALAIARSWSRFAGRSRSSLLAFPVVEAI